MCGSVHMQKHVSPEMACYLLLYVLLTQKQKKKLNPARELNINLQVLLLDEETLVVE